MCDDFNPRAQPHSQLQIFTVHSYSRKTILNGLAGAMCSITYFYNRISRISLLQKGNCTQAHEIDAQLIVDRAVLIKCSKQSHIWIRRSVNFISSGRQARTYTTGMFFWLAFKNALNSACACECEYVFLFSILNQIIAVFFSSSIETNIQMRFTI